MMNFLYILHMLQMLFSNCCQFNVTVTLWYKTFLSEGCLLTCGVSQRYLCLKPRRAEVEGCPCLKSLIDVFEFIYDNTCL